MFNTNKWPKAVYMLCATYRLTEWASLFHKPLYCNKSIEYCIMTIKTVNHFLFVNTQYTLLKSKAELVVWWQTLLSTGNLVSIVTIHVFPIGCLHGSLTYQHMVHSLSFQTLSHKDMNRWSHLDPGMRSYLDMFWSRMLHKKRKIRTLTLATCAIVLQ